MALLHVAKLTRTLCRFAGQSGSTGNTLYLAWKARTDKPKYTSRPLDIPRGNLQQESEYAGRLTVLTKTTITWLTFRLTATFISLGIIYQIIYSTIHYRFPTNRDCTSKTDTVNIAYTVSKPSDSPAFSSIMAGPACYLVCLPNFSCFLCSACFFSSFSFSSLMDAMMA